VRKKRKKITQGKNKSTQAQVTQLTQAVLAQENATIESIRALRAFEWKLGLSRSTVASK